MSQTKRPRKAMSIFRMIGIVGFLLVVFWVGSWVVLLLFLPQTEMIDDKGIIMRLIPAGEFTMGSDSDSDNRNTAHHVYLDAFYMDKYEVTNAHYATCVTARVCEPPLYAKSDFRPSYYGDSLYDNFPVIYVDWTMAIPTLLLIASGTRPKSVIFESGKSHYGLYDMAGNVFEWTSSLPKSYPYDATDGREDPTRGGSRVIRGGAWNEGPNDHRVFYRSWVGPDLSESAIGFRCARSP